MPMQNIGAQTGIRDDVDVRAGKYINGVYLQMMWGVLLTVIVAYGLVVTDVLRTMLFNYGSGLAWGVFALQLGTILLFRPMSAKMGVGGARALYFFYCSITGITVGIAGLLFTMTSIMNVFAAAALAFGGTAMFGHVTKRNLGVVGTFCLQALWMTVAFSLFYAVASYFPFFQGYMPSMNITLGVLGVAVFSGITAYEAQKVRQVAYSLAQSQTSDAAISQYTTHGALNMYLNFINLFFSLLRLFGRRR